MSTQYDAIVSPYNDFRKMPGSLLERHIVQKTLTPFIKGAKMLDLACGSGYYTNLFISWGASTVVGVDISPGMISDARAASVSDKITFLVGDCSQPTTFPGAPFDIVFGAWILNYAPNGAALTNMFRTISVNLKDGGRFFGITPPPSEDPRGRLEDAEKHKPLFYDYVTMDFTRDVDDGISARASINKPAKFEFHYFCLKESVYRRAARDGGMNGDPKWINPTLPADDRGILGACEYKEEEWAKFEKVPHFAIIMAEKQ
ncbi:MAG: hypothetical protein Q9213_000720 [Squamulea squamosa]